MRQIFKRLGFEQSFTMKIAENSTQVVIANSDQMEHYRVIFTWSERVLEG